MDNQDIVEIEITRNSDEIILDNIPENNTCIVHPPNALSWSTCIHYFLPTKTTSSSSINNIPQHKKEVDEFELPTRTPSANFEIQQKRDIMNIQHTLSVSRLNVSTHLAANEDDNVYIHFDQQSPKVELCMEFLWCFPCCFYANKCAYFSNKFRSFQNAIYDVIWNTLYSPLFETNPQKVSKLQKSALFIRLCFELYKTMIGSYLTIFTPQDCGGSICTLYQNLMPKNNLEIVALSMNSLMAASLLGEYGIEITREKILRMYFKNDQRLPVEKEYFTNLIGILDTKKALLLEDNSQMISMVFRLYRRVGIILLSLYVVNVCISAIVIYHNYYDKSSLFGFVTNALFIVLKMASILKIAIHSINMPYSAYIETPVAFNSLKSEYIKPEIKKHFLFGIKSPPTENISYFQENKQYIRVLLEDYASEDSMRLDIDETPGIIRHRKSFG